MTNLDNKRASKRQDSQSQIPTRFLIWQEPRRLLGPASSSVNLIFRQSAFSKPVEPVEDYDGDGDARTIDPQKLWRRRPAFAERVAEARAEVAQKVAAERAARELRSRDADRVHQFFAKQKTGRSVFSNGSAQPEPPPPVQTQERSWWQRHFGAPKRPVWR